jgi:hypothetical protein
MLSISLLSAALVWKSFGDNHFQEKTCLKETKMLIIHKMYSVCKVYIEFNTLTAITLKINVAHIKGPLEYVPSLTNFDTTNDLLHHQY